MTETHRVKVTRLRHQLESNGSGLFQLFVRAHLKQGVGD